MTGVDWIFTAGLAVLASFAAFAYGARAEDNPTGRERDLQRPDRRGAPLEDEFSAFGPAAKAEVRNRRR